MLKRFHLNGHPIGLRSQNCVIPENIHTPRGGQQKFRGEGGPEGGNFRRSGGWFLEVIYGLLNVFFFSAYAINKCHRLMNKLLVFHLLL